jgi:transcriptional regulator with XRE-family HTH domain
LRLKALRLERHLQQSDVARIIGCGQPLYSRYERGEREIPLSALIALADFYGVSLDYLVGRSDDPTFTPSAGTIPCSANKD